MGSQHLQPGNPRQRVHVSDHARRHQAGDRRPPADEPGGRAWRAVGIPLPDPSDPGCAAARLHAAVSDADRVLGLRVREPGRPRKRHRRARQPDGLRGGRREHARDGLLGWRLRLLRTAAEPRRLRRDRNDRPPALGARQQGRHARHLLRRDQPAVHRTDRAARASRRSRRCRRSTRRLRRSIPAASSTPASRSRGPNSASRTPNRPVPAMGRHGRPSGSKKAIRPARPTRPCTARPRT